MVFFLKVKALEKLSKSLKDGQKLAVGESYQDLVSAIKEDHPVQYRHPDKHVSHARKQRPKSLNFEIFFSEQDENKTDDEKIENVNGESNKDNAESSSQELSLKLSKEEELNYDVFNIE